MPKYLYVESAEHHPSERIRRVLRPRSSMLTGGAKQAHSLDMHMQADLGVYWLCFGEMRLLVECKHSRLRVRIVS